MPDQTKIDRLNSEYLETRLKPRGFDCELIRAFETPGDCVHFNSDTDVVELGPDWTRDPFGGELDGDRWMKFKQSWSVRV